MMLGFLYESFGFRLDDIHIVNQGEHKTGWVAGQLLQPRDDELAVTTLRYDGAEARWSIIEPSRRRLPRP